MNGERCLLTGASGFLGRYLVEGLQQAGFHVTGLSRRSVPGIDWSPGDLTLNGSFGLGPGPYQLVVHAAGLAHDPSRPKADFFNVNAEGTRNLLLALDRLPRPPASFVLISTVAVYGRLRGESLPEDTAIDARDPYGASKAAAENIAREWAKGRGTCVAILRLPLVYGENPPGNLGAMSAAIRRGRYAGIRPGTARRSVVWARDVASILPRAAAAGGIYHLTDGDHPSFRQFEEAYAQRYGLPPPPALPQAAARLFAWAGDPLSAVLGARVPLTSDRFRKMTSTLTFADDQARARLGWQPARVLALIRDCRQ
jgi:GlcNAc-P-P-Und epimerase